MFPIFLKRSLVFPFLLFSSIIKHCSLKKALFSLLAILWNSVFNWMYLSLSPLLFASLLSLVICKASSDNHFAFLLFFFFGWFCSLPPVQYYRPPLIVLQAHCLQVRIPWIYSLPPLHIHRGFDLSCTWLACILLWEADDLSHSQLQVLFLLTVYSFSIFSYKECNQFDFRIDHLVMFMYKVNFVYLKLDIHWGEESNFLLSLFLMYKSSLNLGLNPNLSCRY